MYAIANFVFLLISATNLLGLLLRKTPSVRELTVQMIDHERGLERLRGALWMAGLAQVYLVFLIFPLKALNYWLGLGWSILMLIAALETVHTSRTMLAAVAAGSRDARFWLQDSPVYVLYQALYNAATIAVCTYLLIAR